MPTQLPGDFWTTALGQLELQVTRPNFDTWLRNTVGLRWDADDVLVVGVQNDFALEWLRSRMSSLLNQTASRVAGAQVAVAVEVVGAQPAASEATVTSPAVATTPSCPDLITHFTFATFAVVESNRVASEAARRLASGEAPFNPLILYGAPGLGKTHLLHAIGHNAIAADVTVVCLTAEAFVTQYGNAVRTGRPHTFRQLFDGCDLLLLDDFPFLASRVASQEQFFHIFSTMQGRGGHVALTMDLPLSELNGLAPRLMSRLQASLTLELQPPADGERIHLLEAMASQTDRAIDGDILALIAEQPYESTRELEGALKRVLAFEQLVPGGLTIETARRALHPFRSEPTEPTMDDVLTLVARHFDLSPRQLASTSRARDISYARHIAIYLLREHTARSLSEIGRLLGGRDHSTVLSGYQRINQERATLADTQTDIERLETLLTDKRDSA